MDIKKPEEIGKKVVRVTIEVEGEIHRYEGINIFGGVIDEYVKGQAFTVVKPFAVGNFTPGMLLSHISGLINHAVDSCIQLGMPKSIIKELGHLAVEEGAAGIKKDVQ